MLHLGDGVHEDLRQAAGGVELVVVQGRDAPDRLAAVDDPAELVAEENLLAVEERCPGSRLEDRQLAEVAVVLAGGDGVERRGAQQAVIRVGDESLYSGRHQEVIVVVAERDRVAHHGLARDPQVVVVAVDDGTRDQTLQVCVVGRKPS